MNPTNDVFSPNFESKLDPFFTAAVQEDRRGRYYRIDYDAARSMLATHKPLKAYPWAQAPLGMRRIAKK